MQQLKIWAQITQDIEHYTTKKQGHLKDEKWASQSCDCPNWLLGGSFEATMQGRGSQAKLVVSLSWGDGARRPGRPRLWELTKTVLEQKATEKELQRSAVFEYSAEYWCVCMWGNHPKPWREPLEKNGGNSTWSSVPDSTRIENLIINGVSAKLLRRVLPR